MAGRGEGGVWRRMPMCFSMLALKHAFLGDSYRLQAFYNVYIG